MQEYTLINGILIKVMHLIWSHKKNRIVKNIVGLEINGVFPGSCFKPYYLIKAVDVRFDRLALISF